MMPHPAYLIGLALCGAVLTVQAQGSSVEPPFISRSCLWNADKDTYRALHLDRDQIQGLAELRKQFPAVVDGQWIEPLEDRNAPDTEWGGAPVITTSTTSGLSTTGAPATSTAPTSTLQVELRKLLTTEELRAWARRCRR